MSTPAMPVSVGSSLNKGGRALGHSAVRRTTLNAWEDSRVVDAVKKTGRRQLIFAALWTAICLAYPVIHSLADGYEVFFVTDASGGTSREAHDMAVQG